MRGWGGGPSRGEATRRGRGELTPSRLLGHGSWASVGTLPAEPCPVPWAGPGSDSGGELPGRFGLGSSPSLSLLFIVGLSPGKLVSLF